MTTREAFEAWDHKVFALPDRYYTPLYQGDFPSIDVKARWRTWQAATDAALERAADEVSIVDSKTWFENQSMFGVACRKAIRALKDAE